MNNKSCSTCDRRSFDRCNLSGFYIETERKYPDISPCGFQYKGWIPRRGFFKRVRDWFMGVDA